jgi:hypothetical protein
VSRKTEVALRELLSKAIDATVADDRMRALAALNQMRRLLEQDAAERAAKRKSRRPPPCRSCGLQFDFPGQLADHTRLQHPVRSR